MKLLSVSVMRHRGGAEAPIVLGTGYELSSFSFFQRGTLREMITFFSRTIAQRTNGGSRASVEHEGHMCHVQVRANGLTAAVFTDMDYPARAAFAVINKALDEFSALFAGRWERESKDGTMGDTMLGNLATEAQDPTKVDKFARIQGELDETKVILHRTIDSVLQRGEKLDSLVEKSADLSRASQMFYKQAKDQNACCKSSYS